MVILKLKKINFTALKVLFFFLKDVDIQKVLISNKISSGEKKQYSIGYLYNDHIVKLVHIMLSETSTYGKSYGGQTKWMYFLIENNDLLEKYNSIWDKVRADIKILKFKIKFHGDEDTDFFDKKMCKFSSNQLGFCTHKRWELLSTSVLKECKYIEKK